MYKYLDKYAFFNRFPQPLDYKGIKIIGYFPYHVATLNVAGESFDRADYEEFERFLTKEIGYGPDNKYLVVCENFCLYFHDLHGRKASIKHLTPYNKSGEFLTISEKNRQNRNFPWWNTETRTKRLWKSDVRKRWKGLRSKIKKSTQGCAYYPQEVIDWLVEFENIDNIMKKYYK